jgi:hypothetical protein
MALLGFDFRHLLFLAVLGVSAAFVFMAKMNPTTVNLSERDQAIYRVQPGEPVEADINAAMAAIEAEAAERAKAGEVDAINVGALSHGNEKHKDEAATARECFDKNGHDVVYKKSDTRAVRLCLLPKNEGMAIQVVERINGAWEEITAYIDRNYISMEEALGYADTDKGTYGMILFTK